MRQPICNTVRWPNGREVTVCIGDDIEIVDYPEPLHVIGFGPREGMPDNNAAILTVAPDGQNIKTGFAAVVRVRRGPA
jgi:hypothetical protein